MIEQLWVRVGSGVGALGIGAIYWPPASSYHTVLDGLELCFSNFLPLHDRLICLGDFNVDLLKPDSLSSISLIEALDAVGFKQIITEPTRITSTTASLIDLIIVWDLTIIGEVGVRNTHISDHELVYCNVETLPPNNQPKSIIYRDFKNVEYSIFELHVNGLHLDDIVYIPDINVKVEVLTTRLIELFNIHAPVVTACTRTPKLIG